MHCCPNCFSDSFLKNQIRAESRQRNTCAFCESHDIEIIEASSLFDIFAPILDLYVIDDSGSDLGVNIQNDWSTFDELDGSRIVDLLSEITGNPELHADKYKCKIAHDENKLEQWQAFREELKHQNRYFPNLIPDHEYLESLFELLTLPALDVPTNFYRARINATNTPYAIEDMGMPPKELVSNGRANPKGISYLYIASDVKTAVSEVRPFVGDTVTVVQFEVMEPLALVDLRNPRQTISPFALSEDDLSATYRDMPFLILLGDELAKPIVPRVADLEYLPSQYLCEFVKHIGFDGVVYRSSLAEGDNLAIFQEDKLNRISTSDYIGLSPKNLRF